jgi:hypothetical protein
MAIDIGRIREYRERWQAVADRETEERRQESIYLRWRQLNAILCLAMGLGWTPTCRDEEEVAKVRRRWAVLKGADEDVIDSKQLPICPSTWRTSRSSLKITPFWIRSASSDG